MRAALWGPWVMPQHLRVSCPPSSTGWASCPDCTEAGLLSVSLQYVSLPDPREEEKEKKGKRMLMGKGDKLARDEKQRPTGQRTMPLQGGDPCAAGSPPTSAAGGVMSVNLFPSLDFLICRVTSP